MKANEHTFWTTDDSQIYALITNKTLKPRKSDYQCEFTMIDGIFDETKLSMLNLIVERCIRLHLHLVCRYKWWTSFCYSIIIIFNFFF